MNQYPSVVRIDANDRARRQKVGKAQELIRQAHALWDEAVSNLAYSILTDEMKNDYV